ncbi:sulfate ABC transporter ATP-binding protein [Streptomyces sp. CB00455]|nr:sulfate ABC transporter ATP-binding protein [Streptomyces sp. CB00455]
MIELRAVITPYGGDADDEGIDLRVVEGEFVCLLGASGSGKSTLLHLVAGLDHPAAGEVRVLDPRPSLMFQDHALFPWLSAGENIELALRLAGAPRAQLRTEVERLLASVRLTDVYELRVHELSGGMRQRVALARALAQGARLLLMDEPFAALDAITRELLHEELTRVCSEHGLTVLFVTHDVQEAVRLGGRVVLLSSRPGGRIAGEWQVAIPHPRRAGNPAVNDLVHEITGRLGEEVRRHVRH